MNIVHCFPCLQNNTTYPSYREYRV